MWLIGASIMFVVVFVLAALGAMCYAIGEYFWKRYR